MAEHQLTCRTCGKQFIYHRRKAYCSRPCLPSRQHPDLRVRVRARLSKPVQGYTYDCVVCGKTYHPKKRDRDTTCSRECGWRWLSIKNQAQATGLRVSVRVKRGPCAVCGRMHVQSNGRRHCSDACKMASKRPTSTLKAVMLCRVCDQPYAPISAIGTPVVTCSPECRKARQRWQRRASKGTREARLKGSTVEAVSPLRVFKRDGWRCQACGVRTPITLRGTHQPCAPELDHIEPLSKGGAHSYRNTRCLCRACNGAKSDGPGGQLLLFG